MGGGDQCWVGAGGDQLSDELLGIGGADDRLTDKDDVGAAASEAHDVMGAPDSPGRDAYDLRGQDIRDLVEQAAVDGQGVRIPGVDGDDTGARIDRCQWVRTSTTALIPREWTLSMSPSSTRVSRRASSMSRSAP